MVLWALEHTLTIKSKVACYSIKNHHDEFVLFVFLPHECVRISFAFDLFLHYMLWVEKQFTTASDWYLHVIKPKWITAKLIWQELQNHLPHHKLTESLQENVSESSIWDGDAPQQTSYEEAVQSTHPILIELWSFHYVWHRSTSSFQNPMGNFPKSPWGLHKKVENVIAAFLRYIRSVMHVPTQIFELNRCNFY